MFREKKRYRKEKYSKFIYHPKLNLRYSYKKKDYLKFRSFWNHLDIVLKCYFVTNEHKHKIYITFVRKNE